MAAIDNASKLVQTSYMMERVFNDLLDLYHAFGVNFDTERALVFNGQRQAIRLHAENLEQHIKLMLSELTRDERVEAQATERRAEARRHVDDRRHDERASRRTGARRQQDDRRHVGEAGGGKAA